MSMRPICIESFIITSQAEAHGFKGKVAAKRKREGEENHDRDEVYPPENASQT